MISRVTENGEQGASATWICAPSPRSWYVATSRRESSRMVSASWTTDWGGRPPSSCPRLIEPRVRCARTPRRRATATWRSEERRVGKEGRARGSLDHEENILAGG